jgi:F-type H+-transporting ATPase subunit b
MSRDRLIRPAILATALLGTGVFAPVAAQAAEGMPQLNFANPLTLGQAFWMLVIFLVLYWLLKSWALPQVAEVVEARAASIQADLETAQKAKHQADAAVAELMALSQQAHAAAQKTISGHVDAAKAAAARNNAMGALKQVATDTVGSIVERLLGMTPPAAAIDGAVDSAMTSRAA